MDSTIARPTNRVRVMLLASSGCCAIALKALDSAQPSPIAGPIEPIAMVIPATIMETMPMVSTLAISTATSSSSFRIFYNFSIIRTGRNNVNGSQNCEYVGLHLAYQKPEQLQKHGQKQGRNGEQDGDQHGFAHHVPEQPD